MASWTNDNVLEFIDLYRRERALWDPKHPQCRNRNEISEAWQRIQSCLSICGCSISDLKKKKESLMTSFRFHWYRRKKNPHYRTTWFAYNAMETFLSEKYSCDSTNELENEFFDTTEHSYNVDPISCHNTTSEKNNSISKQHTIKSYVIKKRPKKEAEESKSYTKTSNDDTHDLDEYDLYGQLLAKKLRKLDEQHRDVAMHEIDNIMFRAKMQSGTQLSYTTSTSPVPRKMKSPIFIVTQHNNVEYEDENITYSTEHIQSQQPS